ncbi:hypothetical protein ACFWRV_05145 [Streptomyces sp. NPDC058576]|uniref:hypothetical protein n=1 Tax=Streptomyces sp. NPDC058576 TaxID=3346547 RepID=UPI0036685A0A
MIKSKFARAAMVVGASAAMIVGMSPSAQAASDKRVNLPSGRGYMHFFDDGDVFQVCDKKADGHGVTGALWVTTSAGVTSKLWALNDGGDAACEKEPENIGNLSSYQMRVSWNGGGGQYVSEWFNE